MPQALTGVSTKLAAALLLKKGEISRSEVRALPFVETDEAAAAIIATLRSAFKIHVYQRRSAESQLVWEDVIKLGQSD